jgi:catechol 2,3-dioxygenase-like lactoylglutathione lyase family enzyme
MSSDIQRLTHLGICVADLTRSLRFYTEVFGFVETGRFEGKGDPSSTVLGMPQSLELVAVYLERDGWRIELLYYPTPGHQGPAVPRPMNQLGYTHLSFRVANLDAVLARIERCGGRVLRETYQGTFGSKVIFAVDPDGIRFELIEAPGDPNAIPGSDHPRQ